MEECACFSNTADLEATIARWDCRWLNLENRSVVSCFATYVTNLIRFETVGVVC